MRQSRIGVRTGPKKRNDGQPRCARCGRAVFATQYAAEQFVRKPSDDFHAYWSGPCNVWHVGSGRDVSSELPRSRELPVKVLAVDPGSTKSGYVLLVNGVPVKSGTEPNEVVLDMMCNIDFDTVACEWYEPRHGQPTGLDHANTWRWVGRFQQAFGDDSRFHLILRRDVKLNLVGNTRAKDRDIRLALDDRFGGTQMARGAKKCPTCKGKGWSGRGRPPCGDCKATGWEQPPGPLTNVVGHAIQALGVGLTYLDINGDSQ